MLTFVLVLVVLGVATYLLVRSFQQRGMLPDARRSPRATSSRPAVPPRVVAPDDDEDFLRDLDRRRLFPEDPESK